MADAFTPVALGIKPPDPMSGINTYSGILGLQQQKQALQTGQYQQQSAQANASQDQQKNRELQAVSGLMQNVHGGGYRKDDGTFDEQKFADDVQAVAPVYGQDVATSARSQANEIVRNQKAKQDLTDEARASLGSKLSALARDPNTRRGDVIDAYTGWMQDHKDDPAAMRIGIAQAALLPQNDNDPKYRETLGRYAATLTGQPTTTPSTVETAGQVQPGVTSNVTGAFTPGGAPIAKPPTQTTNANQQILNRDPQTGALSFPPMAAPSSGASGAGGINPTSAQQANVTGMATDDRGRYAQISQEGVNATTGAQLADQVAALADQVRTGKLSKEWTDRLSVLQQHDPSLTARQMLSKYAAQLKTMATAGATTDASRSQIDEGMPSPETMGPDAVKEAAQYVGGIFRMRGARQSYADQYAKTNGNSIGIRDADDAFMRAADPTVFTYKSLPAGEERQKFLRKHGLTTQEKLDGFRARLNQVNHYNGGQ
jgi:hypothetical protein